VNAAPSAPAQLIVTGVPIQTCADDVGVVEALGIAHGTVVAAGPLAAIERNARPDATWLQLTEGAILPGFCDTHMHFEKIAGELAMLQLGETETVNEVLQLVAAAAADFEPGEWIQSFGDDNAWHEHQLQERRLPTRAELDDAAPEHPVYLYRGWDAAALNSAAAELLSRRLADEPGWNNHSGHLYSARARALQEELPTPNDSAALLGRASTQLLGFGITTIVDPGLPAAFEATWDIYRRALDTSQVAQRLYLMDRLDHRRPFEEELARVVRDPAARAAVHAGLHGWGLKLLVDGEFANAWMAEGEPQHAPPTKRYTSAELERALRLCAEHAWPVCFHVMGRGAVEAVLSAVKTLGGRSTFEANQVTFAHGFLMSERQMDDCAELDVGVSVQPLLAYVFEREMLEAWSELAHAANPYRLMLDHGVAVAGGSDVLPCEPLRGAAVAVTRTSRHGSRLGADQAITADEAVSLFTGFAGAYVQRPTLGTLRPGAPADFACWPTNPLEAPTEQWPHLRPLFTAVGGAVVWRNDTAPSPDASTKGAYAG
jgi:predicted amidohydrolase YtcJ